MIGSFTRGCGFALCAAAAITLALNVFVTPFLPKDDFTAIAASNAYLIRQCLAALVAALLMFGVIGIHVSRLGRVGRFGTTAFVIAVIGSLCLFDIEYGQVSTFHAIALHAPAALTQVMAIKDSSLAIGASLAVLAFFLGWFVLALSLLLSSHYAKLGPALIMIGLPLSLILGAAGLPTPWPAIASSLATGGGWFLIGWQMIRPRGEQKAS
jgi:hypothetical protein